jgi:hypothetical protein
MIPGARPNRASWRPRVGWWRSSGGLTVERLVFRPRGNRGPLQGGPVAGLSLLHGFFDDRRWIGTKVVLILTLLALVALWEVPW